MAGYRLRAACDSCPRRARGAHTADHESADTRGYARTTAAGDGDPLVLCHGGPGLWDYFDDGADILRGTFRVVRWDRRGCGRSQRRGPYSIARSIADLDAVRDQLAGPRTALLGHSWGAHLALRYAGHLPWVESRDGFGRAVTTFLASKGQVTNGE